MHEEQLESGLTGQTTIRMPLITEIQRFSLQDGPGIRTTIFVKGCPLHCPWCHNPETQSTQVELYFYPDRCVGCGRCAEVCPSGASRLITEKDQPPRLELDRAKCTGCLQCVQACLSGARARVGQAMSLEAIIQEALADQPFFRNSGGGVTLSGGDPLLFPDFALELARQLRPSGLHLAMETSLFANWRVIEPLLPYYDLFLVDLKTMDAAKHQDAVGWPLPAILANLERLLQSHHQVRIHLPIIPNFNDTPSDAQAYADYLGRLAGGLAGVDVLPYHCYGESKYRFLGRSYQLSGAKDLRGRDVLPLATSLKAAGLASVTVGGLVGVSQGADSVQGAGAPLQV